MVKIKGKSTAYVIVLGVVVTIVTTIPLMMSGLWKNGTGHDMFFHLLRIEGICEGIKSGQFPVRIQPEWYNGYGYACSIFYGDVFLLIPAMLHLVGLPLQTAYKIFIVLVNICTFYVAFVSFRGIFDDETIASLGATWYTLSLYRLINVYIRHAVGEYTAMIFFPLIGYALFCLLKKEAKPSKGMKALIIGVTGILQSHIISFELSICVMVVICIIYIKRVFRREVIFAFIKAIGITILLNLWFLVPLMDYMKTGVFNANTVSEYKKTADIGESGLFLKQMFKLLYGAGGVNLPASAGLDGEMPLGVGLGSLIVILLGICVIIRMRRDVTAEKTKFGLVICGGTLMALWMSSLYFPWRMLGKLGNAIKYAIVNIQFPWRLLGIASILIALLVCIIATDKYKTIRIIVIIAFLALGVSDAYMLYDETRVSEQVEVYDIDNLNTCEPSGEEYLPYGTDVSELKEGDVRTTNISVLNWDKNYLTFTASVVNHSDEPGYLLAPMLFYKGYRAVMDDADQTALEITFGDNKRVLVTIPGRTEGIVKIYWDKPILWRVSDAISLLCMVVIAIYWGISHVGKIKT